MPAALLPSVEVPEQFPQAPGPTTGDLIATSQEAGRGDFSRGLRSGFNSLLAGGQALAGTAGAAVGLPEFAANRMQSAREYAQAAQEGAPTLTDYRQVRGLGDATRFAAGALGSGIVSTAPAIAGFALGGVPGAVAGGSIPMAGEQALALEMDPALRATPASSKLGNAALQGLAGGALEAALPAAIGARLARPALRTVAEAGKRVGAGAAIEGATEGAQTVSGGLLHHQLNPEKRIDPHEVVNSILQGAIAGSGFAGAGAAAEAAKTGVDSAMRVPKAVKDTTTQAYNDLMATDPMLQARVRYQELDPKGSFEAFLDSNAPVADETIQQAKEAWQGFKESAATFAEAGLKAGGTFAERARPQVDAAVTGIKDTLDRAFNRAAQDRSPVDLTSPAPITGLEPDGGVTAVQDDLIKKDAATQQAIDHLSTADLNEEQRAQFDAAKATPEDPESRAKLQGLYNGARISEGVSKAAEMLREGLRRTKKAVEDLGTSTVDFGRSFVDKGVRRNTQLTGGHLAVFDAVKSVLPPHIAQDVDTDTLYGLSQALHDAVRGTPEELKSSGMGRAIGDAMNSLGADPKQLLATVREAATGTADPVWVRAAVDQIEGSKKIRADTDKQIVDLVASSLVPEARTHMPPERIRQFAGMLRGAMRPETGSVFGTEAGDSDVIAAAREAFGPKFEDVLSQIQSTFDVEQADDTFQAPEPETEEDVAGLDYETRLSEGVTNVRLHATTKGQRAFPVGDADKSTEGPSGSILQQQMEKARDANPNSSVTAVSARDAAALEDVPLGDFLKAHGVPVSKHNEFKFIAIEALPSDTKHELTESEYRTMRLEGKGYFDEGDKRYKTLVPMKTADGKVVELDSIAIMKVMTKKLGGDFTARDEAGSANRMLRMFQEGMASAMAHGNLQTIRELPNDLVLVRRKPGQKPITLGDTRKGQVEFIDPKGTTVEPDETRLMLREMSESERAGQRSKFVRQAQRALQTSLKAKYGSEEGKTAFLEAQAAERLIEYIDGLTSSAQESAADFDTGEEVVSKALFDQSVGETRSELGIKTPGPATDTRTSPQVEEAIKQRETRIRAAEKAKIDAIVTELTAVGVSPVEARSKAESAVGSRRVAPDMVFDPDTEIAQQPTVDTFSKLITELGNVSAEQVRAATATKPASEQSYEELRDRVKAAQQADAKKSAQARETLKRIRSNMRLGAQPISAADIAAVKAEIDKVLGANADVIVKGLPFSGYFDDSSGVEQIIIAMDALNPMSVAHHESLHAFMARLRRADPATGRLLLAVASQEHVRAKLRELLAQEPDALNQLGNAEERLAYAYQFWRAGQLEFGPRTTSVFDQIATFFRQLIGKLSEQAQAEAFLQAFADGEFQDPSATTRTIQRVDPNARFRHIEEAVAPYSELAGRVFATAGGHIRGFNNQYMTDIVEKFHAPDGSGYVQEKRRMHARFMNRLTDALEGAGSATLDRVLNGMQSGVVTQDPVEVKIRELLDTVYTYMHERGVRRVEFTKQGPVEHVIGKLKDYFPRVYDFDKIQGDRSGFEAMLQRNGVSQADARGTTDAILSQNGFDPTESESRLGIVPFAKHTNVRTLAGIPAAELTPWMAKDMISTMSSYIGEATRRAEYAKRFGNRGEVITQALQDAKDNGATQGQLDAFQGFVRAVEGTLGQSLDPRLRSAFGALVTYQNVRLLPLALFSSLIDPLGIAVRGGSMKDAFGAFTNGMASLFGRQDSDAVELAKLVGTISDDTALQTLGELNGSQYMTGWQRKVNQTLFRWNGMATWNTAMRSSATKAAVNFIEHHLPKAAAGDETSKRFMHELGLDGVTTVDLVSPRMQRAVNAWVDGAVLRPNAVDRPIWHSDPRFMLISHLKGFTYAFQKTILERAYNEMREGNYRPLLVLGSYVPFMIAADVVRAVFTFGTDEWDKWSKRGVGDWIGAGAQRAGLTGAGQFALDAGGQSGLIGFAGPSVQQVSDLLTASRQGKIGDWAVRALPANALYR